MARTFLAALSPRNLPALLRDARILLTQLLRPGCQARVAALCCGEAEAQERIAGGGGMRGWRWGDG